MAARDSMLKALWKGAKSVAGDSALFKAQLGTLGAEAGIGAGIGAVAGGVHDGFSDRGTVLGGMTRGALLGGVGGAGLGMGLRANQAAGYNDILAKMSTKGSKLRGGANRGLMEAGMAHFAGRSQMAFGGFGSGAKLPGGKRFASLASNTPLGRAGRRIMSPGSWGGATAASKTTAANNSFGASAV